MYPFDVIRSCREIRNFCKVYYDKNNATQMKAWAMKVSYIGSKRMNVFQTRNGEHLPPL